MSFVTWLLYTEDVISFRSDFAETQWGAIFGFVAGLIAMMIATAFSEPKRLSELKGLVYGLQEVEVKETEHAPFYKSPVLSGMLALALCALLYVYIAVV